MNGLIACKPPGRRIHKPGPSRFAPTLLLLGLTTLFVVSLAGAASRLRCSVFRKSIQGRYLVYGDRKINVCEGCTKTADRCGGCGVSHRPRALKRVGEKKYCADCRALIPRCAICQNRIIGKYYSVARREGIYCEKCHRSRPSCGACGRPIGSTKIVLADDRESCDECHATSIRTSDKMKSIWKEIKRLVDREIDHLVAHPIDLKLVRHDDPDFDRALEQARPASRERHKLKENGVFVREDDTWRIMVLRPLPRELFYENLAHEYGHAVHVDLGVALADNMTSEGFAQWIEAVVLEKKGFGAALVRMHERTDIYDEGFHRILKRSEAFDRMGRENLIQLLTNQPAMGSEDGT